RAPPSGSLELYPSATRQAFHQLQLRSTGFSNSGLRSMSCSLLMTAIGGRLVCTSRTVMLKVQVAVRPAPSVAVQVTAVAPMGKVLPDAGTQAKLARPQVSEA